MGRDGPTTANACALLSALGFYFSLGLGEQLWLDWLAPIPVLWLAFGASSAWVAFFACWGAYVLGATSILRAYLGVLPTPVLVLAILAPSLLFAAAAMAARRAFRNIGPIAGALTFAALWAAFDFLIAFDPGGGSAATPAASQVAAPMLIQSASLFGFMAITFLLAIVAAGIAASLRSRSVAPAVLAVVTFAANAAFGAWHMSQPAAAHLRVALIDSDRAIGGIRKEDKAETLAAIHAYAAEIEKLRGRGVQLIVLPENIARLGDAWRNEAVAPLAKAASDLGAIVVAGFNAKIDGAQRNVSLAFTPASVRPVTYIKRHLVPGLESTVYKPGHGAKALPGGAGLEICKDMDFQAMIRTDEISTHPAYLAVPAWDFGADGWAHGRIAILRSVEDGVPMARTARDGLLTLNDRYGRLLARKATTAGFTTVVGDLPLSGTGGNTLYDRIGDLFGWMCVVLSIALMGWAWTKPRGPA